MQSVLLSSVLCLSDLQDCLCVHKRNLIHDGAYWEVRSDRLSVKHYCGCKCYWTWSCVHGAKVLTNCSLHCTGSLLNTPTLYHTNVHLCWDTLFNFMSIEFLLSWVEVIRVCVCVRFRWLRFCRLDVFNTFSTTRLSAGVNTTWDLITSFFWYKNEANSGCICGDIFEIWGVLNLSWEKKQIWTAFIFAVTKWYTRILVFHFPPQRMFLSQQYQEQWVKT